MTGQVVHPCVLRTSLLELREVACRTPVVVQCNVGVATPAEVTKLVENDINQTILFKSKTDQHCKGAVVTIGRIVSADHATRLTCSCSFSVPGAIDTALRNHMPRNCPRRPTSEGLALLRSFRVEPDTQRQSLLRAAVAP
ncbi:hypothetical protein VOLCADRAFT_93832 [Volvox carteri f. nagariensis]|uniref:Uncharacterized protein n=1 Tax=Volvox carteri f. nagariensis TaxID=3068 RepID=D8U365_VOLCA|nr:uncharacterized protein VOLCADRAFT_93832 [Volvox carteri f. nagariensis]EFJ45699.1 hypothetical protein VOLCADRAFT_93832 [Volvox carteri f. nagariensis]|eukprot:XP_002953100.1 hypothetical protein VOLCADRAFT_93832 [Volvox carteri f. nagariensis]